MASCRVLLVFMLLASNTVAAGEPWSPGRFSLGMRTTVSTFGHEGYSGLGYGGQFRIQFWDRLNTEWFADYITSNLGNYARRNDGHIGWSVMFYPFSTSTRLVPYFLAGHCFDYTSIRVSEAFSSERPVPHRSRWSSAVQAGLGTHINLDKNLDFSLSGQYMSHLGKDIHVDVHEHHGQPEAHFGESQSILEGHVLFTASINLKIARLWNRGS